MVEKIDIQISEEILKSMEIDEAYEIRWLPPSMYGSIWKMTMSLEDLISLVDDNNDQFSTTLIDKFRDIEIFNIKHVENKIPPEFYCNYKGNYRLIKYGFIPMICKDHIKIKDSNYPCENRAISFIKTKTFTTDHEDSIIRYEDAINTDRTIEMKKLGSYIKKARELELVFNETHMSLFRERYEEAGYEKVYEGKYFSFYSLIDKFMVVCGNDKENDNGIFLILED